ncbi:MAG TPA: hypothetical protein VLJ17_00805 [Xanthobacteraceae bacterium]|nr:hypothetical protein [Xanthobacteraceae bacterium]
MARGCVHRALLAGSITCCAAVGVAVAQEGAEVTEDLGNLYALARRTTSAGSIIQTLLFAGQAIVTDIAVPGPDTGVIAGTTGVSPEPGGSAHVARVDAEELRLGLGPGFGGTWLTGEILDNYLILHRTRASGPVMHEVFHEGHKVGVVTEVSSSVGAARSPGRNSFVFESTDDRFVVHLTQSDGTRIHATTERGRFSGQVVERVAAAKPPSEPLRGLVKPSTGRNRNGSRDHRSPLSRNRP